MTILPIIQIFSPQALADTLPFRRHHRLTYAKPRRICKGSLERYSRRGKLGNLDSLQPGGAGGGRGVGRRVGKRGKLTPQ